MQHTSFTDDLDLALHLADIADSVTLKRFQAEDLVVEAKPDLTPVSDADRAVEDALRAVLSANRPQDAIVGEERGATGESSRQWIIDPIDGTKNFVRGVPVWATLIALVEDNEPVVGVVSAPALNRRWWAATGCGAWAGRCFLTVDEVPGKEALTSTGDGDENTPEEMISAADHTALLKSSSQKAGTEDSDSSSVAHTGVAFCPQSARRLSVSAVASLEDAFLSYSSLHGWAAAGLGQKFDQLLDRCWYSRAYGDFFSYMLVAEGAVDIACEPELALHDMAALVPIVREAGGIFTSIDGIEGPWGCNAVAANPQLHTEFMTIFS